MVVSSSEAAELAEGIEIAPSAARVAFSLEDSIVADSSLPTGNGAARYDAFRPEPQPLPSRPVVGQSEQLNAGLGARLSLLGVRLAVDSPQAIDTSVRDLLDRPAPAEPAPGIVRPDARNPSGPLSSGEGLSQWAIQDALLVLHLAGTEDRDPGAVEVNHFGRLSAPALSLAAMPGSARDENMAQHVRALQSFGGLQEGFTILS